MIAHKLSKDLITVRKDQHQGCGLKFLVLRAEYLKEDPVARLQGPKIEHHQKNWWDGNLAPRHVIDHPVKAQTKGHNLLRFGHAVIEQ
jgi:hypothetical protein